MSQAAFNCINEMVGWANLVASFLGVMHWFLDTALTFSLIPPEPRRIR
jgi:hypothetical protein